MTDFVPHTDLTSNSRFHPRNYVQKGNYQNFTCNQIEFLPKQATRLPSFNNQAKNTILEGAPFRGQTTYSQEYVHNLNQKDNFDFFSCKKSTYPYLHFSIPMNFKINFQKQTQAQMQFTKYDSNNHQKIFRPQVYFCL
jgi:hypothetical protein